MRCGANVMQHTDHLKRLIREQKPMTKLDILGDARVIRFGSLLRAAGLDELPQLYNILRGEMSLVGPRPCTPAEYETYLPWHKNRFLSTPGITGLWQVNGKNRTTFDEMIQLDIEYASRRSLWLDLRILFKTFWVVGVQICEIVVVKIARAMSHLKAAFAQTAQERTNGRGR
jgi:lipopolysaccharide/colanic/teichoic acid biosynthesis glycosyltransferase